MRLTQLLDNNDGGSRIRRKDGDRSAAGLGIGIDLDQAGLVTSAG
jgi:hypothetical protein